MQSHSSSFSLAIDASGWPRGCEFFCCPGTASAEEALFYTPGTGTAGEDPIN